MDKWKSQVLKLETPEQVRECWNTEESSQFIWVDDAFGVTQYESHLVMGWNRTLDSVSTMIRRGHRIVLTSRDYIYNAARRDLKRSSFPLLEESQVVIDVKQLTSDEREQILYNHVELGDQPPYFRAQVKRFLPGVAAHNRFVPETARRLGNSHFTQALSLSKSCIDDFVTKQEQLLVDTMFNMDADSRAALALLYIKEGAIESPFSLVAEEERAIARLGSDEAGCIRALEDLNGSFVQLVDTQDGRIWRYKHPTIGDAFALILAQSPEHLRIFVDGTSIERLMDLVSCGEVDVKNATVIPRSMFETFVQRIYEYANIEPSIPNFQRGRLYSFLKDRASRDFLVQYLEVDKNVIVGIVDDFKWSWFSSKAGLTLRLNRLGLLPESARSLIVDKILSELHESDDLSYIYDQEVHEFFTLGDLKSFLDDVRLNLQATLDGVRKRLIRSHNFEDDPEEHMAEFVAHLDRIQEVYADWPDIKTMIAAQVNKIDSWAYRQFYDPLEDETVNSSDLISTDTQGWGRSIFDDIDQ
jgi:hypothetical protein